MWGSSSSHGNCGYCGVVAVAMATVVTVGVVAVAMATVVTVG